MVKITYDPDGLYSSRFLCKEDSEIVDLPTDVRDGSIALVIGSGTIYVFYGGIWVKWGG